MILLQKMQNITVQRIVFHRVPRHPMQITLPSNAACGTPLKSLFFIDPTTNCAKLRELSNGYSLYEYRTMNARRTRRGFFAEASLGRQGTVKSSGTSARVRRLEKAREEKRRKELEKKKGVYPEWANWDNKFSQVTRRLKTLMVNAPLIPVQENSCEIAIESASLLVDIIFQTLFIYDDRPSQAAVDDVVVNALREPAFVKAFAGALVQSAEKHIKAGLHLACYKLLRWSCLLVRWSPSVITAKNAFMRVASIQASLLCVLLQSPVHLQKASKRIFIRLLREVPGIFKLYVGELQNSCFKMENNAALVGVLLEYSANIPSLFEENKLTELSINETPRYDVDKASKSLSSSFHDISNLEFQDNLARFWVDMGTSDPLALDVLINALICLSSDYIGIKQLVFGGKRLGDWEQGMTSVEDGYKVFKI